MNTRDRILYTLKHEPYRIGHMVGFDKLSPMHNNWMISMLYGRGDMTLQAHRLSYKTTCVAIVLAILMVTHPVISILFIRKTDTDTVEIISQVRKILENERFKALVKALYGVDLTLTKSTSTELTTNLNQSPRGASQLLGIGTSGSITGKHVDYIFTDDIINIKDRQSHAERERVKAFYMELQNVKNRPHGRIINTGTPWHKEDCFTIMPEAEKWDYVRTGMIDPVKLQELRDSMTPSLFAANYELKHIAAEDALFDTPPRFFDKPELMRDGIAHIDASYGGEDFTAFTCMKREGDVVYAYGKLWHAHVDTKLDYILAECDRLICSPIHCEDNGDKGYLAKEIKRRGVYGKSYTEHENKVVKISTYLRKWWKSIVWLEGTDPDYLDQILDYTEDAEHDDAPDSAACLCRIIDKHTY